MAAVIVPARAGVLSAVGLLTSPIQRDLVRSWPTPARPHGAGRRSPPLGRGGRQAGRAATPRPRRPSTAATPARATSSPCVSVAAFHEAHRQRNGFARPDAPVEVVAIRATASLPSGVRPDRPAGAAAVAGARAGRHRRAGLHDLAPRRLDAPSPAPPAPSCCGGDREPRRRGPAGADVPARRHRRRDGRGAATVGVEPQHQGAGRLLGGRVRRRRATCSPRPSTSRCTSGSMPASVRAAIDAYGGWLEPGDHVVVNDPFAGGTHLNDITVVTPVFDDERGSSGGWRTGRTTPTSAAPHPARSPPTPPRSSRRASGSRPPATRRSCAACCWPRRARRTSGPATSTRRSAPTSSASNASLDLGEQPFDEVHRVRRAPHAGRARGAARRAVALRGRARLDGRGAGPAAPGDDRGDRHHRRRRDHLRLHRHRSAGARQRQRRHGGHRLRGRLRAADARSIRRSPPTAARCDPCTSSARAGRSSARSRPPRSGPATSR